MRNSTKQGVKLITIVDPGVKHQPVCKERGLITSTTPELEPQDQRYYVFESGSGEEPFSKTKERGIVCSESVAGRQCVCRLTRRKRAHWWGNLHRAYTDNGVAGIWNDMNEPADFVDQTGKNQIDVVSYDEGENSTHAKNRNVFALLMARATYEGLERLRPDRRPYVITRAGLRRNSKILNYVDRRYQ